MVMDESEGIGREMCVCVCMCVYLHVCVMIGCLANDGGMISGSNYSKSVTFKHG